MSNISAKLNALALINGYQSTCLIVAAHEVGLFSALRAGPPSVNDLGVKLGIEPYLLFRFLRALESLQLLHIQNMNVMLSESAQFLAADESSLGSMPVLIAQQYLPSWANLSKTLRNGQPAFEQIFGVSVWKHREDHPKLNDAFGRMIKEPATNEIAAILAAYDFSGVRTIVDVGGGSGWLLVGILNKHVGASGILFDQPHVVAGFLERIEAEGIEERCAIVGGSFFDAVPHGGDLYVLQSILHDWSDEECIRILGTVRKSMSLGAKLLILERILPVEGAMPIQMAMLDMHMMAVLGGRERNISEFDTLLEKGGLRRVRVIPTIGFAADLIEAERVDLV